MAFEIKIKNSISPPPFQRLAPLTLKCCFQERQAVILRVVGWRGRGAETAGLRKGQGRGPALLPLACKSWGRFGFLHRHGPVTPDPRAGSD